MEILLVLALILFVVGQVCEMVVEDQERLGIFGWRRRRVPSLPPSVEDDPDEYRHPPEIRFVPENLHKVCRGKATTYGRRKPKTKMVWRSGQRQAIPA